LRVYVLNQRKEPLMPCGTAKARRLLKQGKAKVTRRDPFTIQLLYATGETKQDITLGVDAGSKKIGLSATTEKKELYSNVKITYGYITKNTRINHGLPKEHRVDARCITGNPTVKPLDCWYNIKKVRCHNRQIHKANILKGGLKKLNQAPYVVKGFRLFDKVKYQGQECFIFGRRSSGYFDLRKLDGTVIHRSASYKKLKLIQQRKSLLIKRRMAFLS
jgi:hypothetical protein